MAAERAVDRERAAPLAALDVEVRASREPIPVDPRDGCEPTNLGGGVKAVRHDPT
jgi:hypothetical protein